MKKIVLLTVICCMLVCSLSAFATAENIIINGENITIPEDMGKVVEKDDRTFVPIRFVAEYLGCTVDYKESPERAIIFDPATSVSYLIMPDDNKIFVLPNFGNGTMITMDTNVFVNNEESRMYIPVRFFAQAIGYDVEWDEATLTVSMFKTVGDGEPGADDVVVETPAEEVVEETEEPAAEETTEDATEEVVEEVAEEITEEVTEEAVDETASEGAEN